MASMSLPEAIRGSASAAIAANTKSGAIITVNDHCQPADCTTSGTIAGNKANPALKGAEPQTA